MKRSVILVLALLMAFSSLAFVPEADRNDNASVYVIHGIPGQDLGLNPDLPVDISVDGACALEDFIFGQIVGPLMMPAGNYDIQVHLAEGFDPCDGPVAIDAPGVPIVAGETASIIAHLTENGDPTASKFVDDVSLIDRADARLTVRHTAAAPVVDIELSRARSGNEIATIEDLANPDQAGPLDVRFGKHMASIFPAGSNVPVFGPVGLALAPRVLVNVYAVGSLSTGSFTLITQQISLPSVQPPLPGYVSVIHGVPGLVVDVYVNGGLFLEDFAPETITDSVPLPAGTYDIEIYPANADPVNDPPAISGSVDVASGVNASLVAHLAEDGTPTLSAFLNDVTDLAPGNTRLTVRHTAAAPAVDVSLSESGTEVALIEDLANPGEATADVSVGRYEALIFPAGGNTPVFGPVPLDLKPHKLTIVYAIGSLDGGSFTLLVQFLSVP